MSSLHPARRSAERFHSLLEGEQGRRRRRRDAELLELVGALQTRSPGSRPAPEFVADLRERLMLAAETELVVARPGTDGPDRPPHRPHPRVPRASAASPSPWVASPSSAPPRRWPWPRRARCRATSSTRSSGRWRTPRPASASATRPRAAPILGNASGRLDEVDALTQQGGADAERRLADARHVRRPGHRGVRAAASRTTRPPAPRTRSTSCATSPSDSIETLARPRGVSSPAEAEAALLAAAQVLFQIDAVAATACPLCDGLGINDDPARRCSPAVTRHWTTRPSSPAPSRSGTGPAKPKPKPARANKPPIKSDEPGVTDGAVPTRDGPTDPHVPAPAGASPTARTSTGQRRRT